MPSRSRRSFSLGLLAGGVTAAWKPVLGYPNRVQIETLRDVLNVGHLDMAARRTLSAEAYHFIVGASDDLLTKSANREAFDRVRIRPRRLVDVRTVDMSVELFGQTLKSPILLAPTGDQRRVHEEGELAVARGAAKQGHLLIAAMMSNFSLGEIAAAGGPQWLQLYPTPNRDFMVKLVRDAERAGCTALVITIDGPTRGNNEAFRWFLMHKEDSDTPRRFGLGNFTDFDGAMSVGDPSFTWEDVDWLSQQTELPVVLKGIVTAEDARLCRRHNVAGVIVSNHGGRQEGSGRGTLDVLPEVVDVLGGRMPVLMDGGVRRGSDVFKALALGADAVCMGRPYLWGLGAFGQPGVEKCLRILRAEFKRTMQYAGAPSLGDITSEHVWRG